MIPGVRRPGTTGQSKSARYARHRREQLGLTQAEVAAAAGVRDVKTIRNLETGRHWPNDLTRRGIETALQIEIGALDRLADDDDGDGSDGDGEADAVARPRPLDHTPVPTAHELIDLASAISKLLQVHAAMLARGDSSTAAQVRGLIDAVSALMAGYRPALEQAARIVDRSPPTRPPPGRDGRDGMGDQVGGGS